MKSCVVLFVSSLTGLGTRSENNDILVLWCIGCVEPKRVVMTMFKTMMKLGFGIGITT
jgi:hypothetical protein